MERLFTQLPIGIIFISVVLPLFVVAIFFITKQFTKGLNKGDADKLLLKQLLEGFGLEVPPELNEREVPVIESIKGP